MKNKWPTQEKDIKVAIEIIDKHIELNDGKPLDFLDVVYDVDDKQVCHCVDLPPWMVELTNHFIDQYGLVKGKIVAKKVLTKCLLFGQTIH